ncbi:MAG: c-type cytochrome [Burkholderiales bacterium]
MARRLPARVRASARAVLVATTAGVAIVAAHAVLAADAKQGAAKAEACIACHGTAYRPPLPGAPTLAGQQAEFLEIQMVLFREGLRDAPQMSGVLKGMSDRDLTDIAAHFAGQKRLPNARKADVKLQARGAELAGSMGCGSCHMPDYSGQRHVPRLTGQPEDYLAAAMKAYRDDKRVGTDTNMNGILRGMTDGEIQSLAHYLAHL